MLKENLENVLQEIKCGNNLGEPIHLVGATKTIDVETINEAISYGLKIVAENKVQEFRDKSSLIVGAEQQFIGHLQTNKVKYLVGKVSVIQSVDSIHLAESISKECEKKNVTQDILCEINIGGELSKSGFTPENAIESVINVSKLDRIKVVGLMAMLPPSDDEQLLVSLCKKMREIYDELNNNGFNLKYLSVGMSADYKIAIKNGSNMIRLGSHIFGKRNYLEK